MKLETPKRKPTTQEQIIRQSCLKASVEYVVGVETKKSVIEVAREYEQWVHREV